MPRRAQTWRAAAVLAVAALGLSACAAQDASYDSVDALVAAYLDAGGTCEDFVVYDESGGDDAAVAHCGTDTVLTLTDSDEATSDVATGAMLRGATVLVGANWVVQDPEAPRLREPMGGTLLALQEGDAPSATDDDAFVFGSGDPVIEVVVDPLCDFCQRFIEASGETLTALADAGEATVEYRVVSLHDTPENGFGSSYGANALACAAEAEPASFRPLLAAVLDGTGAEGGVWTEDSLTAAAADAGADAAECISEGRYLFWAMDSTRTVIRDGLPSGGLGGVPTITIDGEPYAQSVDDADAFADAVAAR